MRISSLQEQIERHSMISSIATTTFFDDFEEEEEGQLHMMMIMSHLNNALSPCEWCSNDRTWFSGPDKQEILVFILISMLTCLLRLLRSEQNSNRKIRTYICLTVGA
jgi:hypothetical protein